MAGLENMRGNVGNTSQPHIVQFLTVQPKALGTVQIMIGVVTFLFGIVLVSDPPFAPVSVISGNVYWASIVYIIAGSLSVAAENKLHPCLVQGSLGMNVVSAVFSVIAISLLTWDLFLYYVCSPYTDCSRFETRSKAISGCLLFFAVLQFIISTAISAFACKATCCSEPTVPAVFYANQAAIGNPQVSVVAYANQAAISNPQVPVVAYASQAAIGNPQNVVNIPKVQMHTSSPAPQNVYEWPHSR